MRCEIQIFRDVAFSDLTVRDGMQNMATTLLVLNIPSGNVSFRVPSEHVGSQ
jgi:hypothetical protein